MEPKVFFRQPTAAEIKKYATVREITDDLVDNILGLGKEEAVIIKLRLVPEEFEDARKFLKHGRAVKLPEFASLEDAVKARKTPLQLREAVFNEVTAVPYCGYTFQPISNTGRTEQKDQRTRKVHLVECLEGTKIYGYVHQEWKGLFAPAIEITPYADAHRVEREGAEIIVKVPSRMKNSPRYQFKRLSAPIIDTKNKWVTALSGSTTHNCSSKLYNIRYRFMEDKESSNLFNFCAHEIAGDLEIMDWYWDKEKNIVPYQMNPFAIPTSQTIAYYNQLGQNCLIQTPDDKTARKLNRAEKEILLWGLVHKLKHDATFFPRGEKLRDYKW